MAPGFVQLPRSGARTGWYLQHSRGSHFYYKHLAFPGRNEDEDGYYTVTVPALPGCVTQGRTKGEALERVKEAILGYIESLQKDGLPVPQDVEVAEVSVAAKPWSGGWHRERC